MPNVQGSVPVTHATVPRATYDFGDEQHLQETAIDADCAERAG
jgi:hypothetical protein